MKPEIMQKIKKAWPKFTPRVFDLLSKADCSRGALFLSKDNSGEEIITFLAQEITGYIIKYENDRKEKWEIKTACVWKRNFQENLYDRQKGIPCIIINSLNKKPKWLYGELKRIFEHPSRPCLILASAENEKGIADYLSGHFLVFRKSGRPRKQK